MIEYKYIIKQQWNISTTEYSLQIEGNGLFRYVRNNTYPFIDLDYKVINEDSSSEFANITMDLLKDTLKLNVSITDWIFEEQTQYIQVSLYFYLFELINNIIHNIQQIDCIEYDSIPTTME